ncbi:hypothetical protein C9374_003330 [Naegleria lovaniensis]|uniref:Phosphoenolpyruvate carboxykinase (ATP) n=1 Tax=Naegleria lovaniensis TaxID=51637 RepID=A0AA88GRG4_NAELO|nr:uncharacterized protein C9374_003330 [Naegleria lovaniensis]KAG2385515.1 hypothetical protein C9374_003330 [Naegleria lovaniensis]
MKTPRNTRQLLAALVQSGTKQSCCNYSTSAKAAPATNVLQQHLASQTKIMHKAQDKYLERVVQHQVDLMEDRNGDDAQHNWSLGKAQIYPQFDAYRNADVETLVKKSFGQVDGEKQFLRVKQINDINDYQKLVSQENKQISTGSYTSKDEKFHRRTQRETGWYLSHTPNSFTQDGAFGSSNQHSCLIRVVTDNSVSGLFLKNMILPIRKTAPSAFSYDSLILHAPGFQFIPPQVVEEFSGPTPKDLGLSNEHFVFENDQTNTSVIGGLFSSSILLDNMAYFGARAIFSKTSAVVLPSDSIINKDNWSSTLFINSNNTVRSALANSNNLTLYGAHYNLLSELGLSRCVGGLLLEVESGSAFLNKLKSGDLVEESTDGKKARVITSLKQGVYPNIVHTPKNIVFVVEDNNFIVPLLGKVKNPQQFFQRGLTSIGKEPTFNKSFTVFGAQRAYADAQQVAEAFAKINKASNVYIVNGSYDEAKIQQAISLISSGEASTLKEEQPNSVFSILSHSSIENKAWKDQTKYTAAIKQLEEKFL